MTRSFRIGRIFGIDIEIDYTWFIVFLLLAGILSAQLFGSRALGLSLGMRWLMAALTTLLFFGSVLLHELSHSLVALRYGLGITGITLFLFGGVSKMSDEPKSPGAEFKIAVAGPAMSVALAVIFFLLARFLRPLPGGPVFATLCSWLAVMNGILAVFNLLPGFPLDGGRVLRAGLWHSLADLTEATRIAATFGQGLGVMMIVGGIFLFLFSGNVGLLWISFVGWFLTQAAQSSYQQLVLRRALSGFPVSAVMTEEVQSVPADIPLDRVVHDYVMAHNHPAFPVFDNDQLLGLLCLSDIRNVPRERWSQVLAREVTPPLSPEQTILPTADAWEAMARMASGNCGRLLVVQNGTLYGIISRTDIMRLMRTRMELGV